jgi:hypothetical protein
MVRQEPRRRSEGNRRGQPAYGGEMSALLQIRGQLDTAVRRVTELEKSLAANPNFPSIAANLDSAVRIQKNLEAQFEEANASSN